MACNGLTDHVIFSVIGIGVQSLTKSLYGHADSPINEMEREFSITQMQQKAKNRKWVKIFIKVVHINCNVLLT